MNLLSQLSIQLHAWARGRLILAFFAAFLVFNAVILPKATQQVQAASGSATAVEGLDLKFFYTPEKAYAIIAAYNDAVRAQYRNYELTGDIIEPVLYSLAFALLISWLFRRGLKPGSRLQKLNVLPIGAGIFDVLENICIVTMLSAYPAQPALVAWASTVCTMSKWGFLGASVVLVLFGLVKVTLNGVRKRGIHAASNPTH